LNRESRAIGLKRPRASSWVGVAPVSRFIDSGY
jgi:hypothetical protein